MKTLETNKQNQLKDNTNKNPRFTRNIPNSETFVDKVLRGTEIHALLKLALPHPCLSELVLDRQSFF
jgi:hypothetical protein